MSGSELELSDEQSLDADLHRIDEQVRVGRYRLCYELGAGGMATVFLARAEGPGGFAKPVAIKRIHPHLARRKDLVEMFLDEARIASAISHPNVCSTFDFGEADGAYYLAMEYLVGEPLSLLQRRIARQRGLLESQRWQRVFAKIIADVGEGLHAAHELKDERGRSLNVIHRDVSPQNVFVTYDGVAKVVDFGVAFASDRITRTVTGGIKGKLGYFAPEQIAREPYDRRVDVWALGIVLWEGLTGHRLFLSRSEVDTLLAVQHKVIAPPSSLVPGIPPELDAIALRALQRDPTLRYPTARAMSRELVAFLGRSGTPIDNVEVGELVQEVCADRRDVRAEVVASVMEDRPRTATAGRLAVPELHDQPTEIAAATEIRAVAPQVPPRAAPRPPPTLPAPTPATPPDAASQAGIVRLALLLMAGVAVAALAIVALSIGGSGPSTPVATPLSVDTTRPAVVAPASMPVVLAPDVPADAGAPAVTPVPPAVAVIAPEVEDIPEEPVSPPTTTAADPPRRGRGDVAVTSPIAVEVCYRRECRWTPTVLSGLPSGRVTLTLRARDGRSWSRAVSVPAGGTARLNVTPP